MAQDLVIVVVVSYHSLHQLCSVGLLVFHDSSKHMHMLQVHWLALSSAYTLFGTVSFCEFLHFTVFYCTYNLYMPTSAKAVLQ